jgi:polyribonucleotide nucleotidyltransferase
VNIKEFGVFFEILPGVDGMCHVSELDMNYVKNPNDFCKVGDKMEVKLIAVDDLGRLKISRKAVIDPNYKMPEPTPAGERKPSGDRGGRGGGGGRR